MLLDMIESINALVSAQRYKINKESGKKKEDFFFYS